MWWFGVTPRLGPGSRLGGEGVAVWAVAAVTLALAGGGATGRAQEMEPLPIPLPADRPARLVGEFQVATLSTLGAGGFCPEEDAPCVLGGGLALGAAVERRWPSGVGIGLGYDLWLLDAAGLYEVFVVQAISAAVRYTALPSRRVHPYVEGRVGAIALGGGFQVSALGAAFEPRGGIEVELTARSALLATIGLRWMLSTPFTTQTDGVERAGRGSPGLSLALGVGLLLLEVP